MHYAVFVVTRLSSMLASICKRFVLETGYFFVIVATALSFWRYCCCRSCRCLLFWWVFSSLRCPQHCPMSIITIQIRRSSLSLRLYSDRITYQMDVAILSFNLWQRLVCLSDSEALDLLSFADDVPECFCICLSMMELSVAFQEMRWDFIVSA